MKNFIILIPVYNDWESLIKLLDKINLSLKKIENCNFKCLIINDCSSIDSPKIPVPNSLKSIEIINMKKNQGHARCIAFGIMELSKKNNFDYLILMDGDGEDRPEEINLLVEKALLNQKNSVVAKRVKRSEGVLFKMLYQIHKIVTLIFTGKKINFGNYSCLKKSHVKVLSSKASLWSSFSGTLKKFIINLSDIDSSRGIRYFGPSKMSILKLILHSFSIIAVFKTSVLIRSTIAIMLLSFLPIKFQAIGILIQILLIFFNLIIFIISFRESEKNLSEAFTNEKSREIYTS